MSTYINEAFKTLFESEDFDISPEGLDNLGTFINKAMDDEVEEVIDMETELEDELKQSYIGKIICDCNVCHSNIFYNKEDIVVEEGIANIDDECPYCMSMEGYTIVGEIKPYSEGEDYTYDEEEEEPDEFEAAYSDEADEPIEIEEPEDADEEDETVVENLQLSGRKELKGRKTLRHRDEHEGHVKLRGKNNTKLSGDLDLHESTEQFEICKVGKNKYALAKNGIINARKAVTADSKEEAREILIANGYKPEELMEAIENVSIDTEDETMTMTTKDDGGVVIETSPRDSFDEEIEDDFEDDILSEPTNEFDGNEVIAPLDDETMDELELSDDEAIEDIEGEDFNFEDELNFEDEVPEEEPETDEFDEEEFDNLGESFLRRCYNNVKGFNTTKVVVNENFMTVYGNIKFKSGNTKKTSFVFEAKSTRRGKYIFEGYNTEIHRGKKAFRLNCSIVNKKIIPESMKYSFTSKNNLNESVKMSGTVKNTRRG